MLGANKPAGVALDYGKDKEDAMQCYLQHQHVNGHSDSHVVPSGFIVSEANPFLGASPDGAVNDPDCVSSHLAFIEIKCSYKYCKFSYLCGNIIYTNYTSSCEGA